MINVYAYKRNLDGSFEVPFFNQASKEDVRREVNYLVISDPDKAMENHLDAKTLCFLGEFDFEKGVFFLVDPVELIDLSVPYHQIMELRKNAN